MHLRNGLTTAHFLKCHRAQSVIVVIRDLGNVVFFLSADLVSRQSQIAVPKQRVPGEVKMQIDDQRLCHGTLMAGGSNYRVDA